MPLAGPGSAQECFPAFTAARGLANAEFRAASPLETPEDFWAVVQGTGYRWVAQQLDPAARARLRESVVGWIRDHEVVALETNVLYALAVKR